MHRRTDRQTFLYVCMYVCMYIYMVTPPPPQDLHPPLPHDSQRLLLYIGHYAENTVNSDTIVPFAMCMQTVLLQVAGLICV